MITDGSHDSDFGRVGHQSSNHHKPHHRQQPHDNKEVKVHQPFFMPLRIVGSDIETMARNPYRCRNVRP